MTGNVYTTGLSDGCIEWTNCALQGVGMVATNTPSQIIDRTCACDTTVWCIDQNGQALTVGASTSGSGSWAGSSEWVRATCESASGTFTPGYYTGSTGTCELLSECGSNSAQLVAPTPTTDRTCQCDSGYWHPSGKACSAWSTCPAGKFQTVAPSATSNVACQIYTTCNNVPDNKYTATAESSTSDRICGNLTDCLTTQYQSTAATQCAALARDETHHLLWTAYDIAT